MRGDAFKRVADGLERVGSRRGQGGKEGELEMWNCPAHEDRNPSLQVKQGQQGIWLNCFAGCDQNAILDALGLDVVHLIDDPRKPGGADKPGIVKPAIRNHDSAGQPDDVRDHDLVASDGDHAENTISPDGLTLADYATAKALPIDLLQGLGLRGVSYHPKVNPCVEIPYYGIDGEAVATRYRGSLEKGPNQFFWKSRSKPVLYGLWRLAEMKAPSSVMEQGGLILVEGESDAQSAWHHGVPALGIPGANNWRNDWAKYLEGFTTIYAVIEPDQGGEAFRKALSASPVADRLRLVSLGEFKDLSALHLADSERFDERLGGYVRASVSVLDLEKREADASSADAWTHCCDLAQEQDILLRLVEDMEEMGAVGEDRAAKVIYLAMTSRLLERPVSVVVKGPSSAGKSKITDTVVKFFPGEAVCVMSGMSSKYLAYSDEDLRHRMLVIAEAAALTDEFASYTLRSLLSEGRFIYKTVQTENGKLKPVTIEKLGPTGAIITTTAIKLHAENETRLLSIPVNDSKAQTARIMAALANGHDSEPDLGEWHALQNWLQGGEHRVYINFAEALSQEIPPVAVRLRRDFGQLLQLIRAHALLHRATREVGEDGIIATLEDYTAVRQLVGDLIGEAIAATVTKQVRETVEAVASLIKEGRAGGVECVTLGDLGKRLNLDKPAASRRWRAAADGGYLRNLEDRKGRPARIVLGDPLPDDIDILPTVEVLQRCMKPEREGRGAPLGDSDSEATAELTGGMFD